jgi:hypothetical protein
MPTQSEIAEKYVQDACLLIQNTPGLSWRAAAKKMGAYTNARKIE